MHALMDKSRTVRDIANSIDVEDRIVEANLQRMMHLGLVVTATLATVFGHDDLHLRLWSLTQHAREHDSVLSNCWACRLRLRYLTANEALYE